MQKWTAAAGLNRPASSIWIVDQQDCLKDNNITIYKLNRQILIIYLQKIYL